MLAEASGHWRYLPGLVVRAYGEWMDATIDLRTEIQEFLRSRRARIAPEMAGLPAYGRNRRVKGLRREEVALLAGVSVEYYVRIERGSLAGTSEGVIDALATALQLNEVERDHLFDLARQSGAPQWSTALQTLRDCASSAARGARCHHRCAGVDPQRAPRCARHESTWSRAVFTGAGGPATARQHSAFRVLASQRKPRRSSSTMTRWREMRPRCCAWNWVVIRTTRSSSPW